MSTTAGSTSTTNTTTTVMSVSGVPGISKLEGRSNFATWKFQMKCFLIDCGLWGAVQGTDTNAVNDQRALAKIGMAVATSVYSRILSSTTSKAAWDKLVKDFGEQGVAGQLILERRLYRARLDEFKSVDEYISHMLTVRGELADCGVEYSDEKLAAMLLHGLPDSCTSLILAYGAANTKVTLDSVLAFLHNYDEGTRERQTETALSAAKSMPKKNSNNSADNNNFVPTCYHCQKKGHKKPDCAEWKKLKKEKKKLKKDGATNSQAENSSGSTKSVGLLTVVAMSSAELGNEDWYFDSCCSRPISHREDLADFINVNESREVLVADNTIMKSKGVGDVTLLINNKGVTKATISDVTFCPDSAANLLSVYQIAQKRNVLVFDEKGVNVFPSDKVKIQGESILTGSAVNNIYRLDRDGVSSATVYDNLAAPVVEQKSEVTAMLTSDCTQELWHQRMGHLNYNDLSKLNKLVDGIVYTPSEKEACVSCIKGKHSKLPFSKPATRATKLLELIHSDVCFPKRSAVSYGGATCFVTFTDDFSRMSFAYFLKTKGEVFAKFKEFKLLVENQTDCKIKRFRSDNGKEFDNADMKQFCTDHGIALELTVPYTPEQNGVSERLGRTIVDRARAMLIHAKLDKRYWAEAVNCAIYLKNRSPTVALDNKVPLEVWTSKKVDVSNVRVFGCKAMEMIPKEKRKKFDPKSEEKIMVGYGDGLKGYRLADPKNPGHVIVARNVIFLEKKLGCILEGDVVPEFQELIPEWEVNVETTVQTNVDNMNNNHEEKSLSENSDTGEDDNESEVEENPDEPLERPQRDRRPPIWQNDYVMFYCSALSAIGVIPSSVTAALNDPKWKSAMLKEIDALLKNGVYELVDRPKGNIVKSKWVFKIKEDAAGNYDCHKARVVARGFSQIKGEDFEETYAPVIRPETLILVMAIANELKYDMEHVDITTAFLNIELTETIYMEQPPGFAVDGKVCALKKSIYGLKQASRAWNQNIRDFFKEIGYTQSLCDPCVFVKKEGSLVIYVCLYVDDIFVFTNWSSEKENLYKCLSNKYNVKFLGELKNCLGMRVTYDKEAGVLKLDQRKYMSELLKKFDMSNATPKSTPMSAGRELPKYETKDNNIPYQEFIGSLMYLAISTRPDLMYTVCKLSQYNKCYGEMHWAACKRVMRYIVATIDHGLVFKRSGNIAVEVFVDASFHCDNAEGFSHTGYVATLGGSVFAWRSKQLKTVTLSSTESEYHAVVEGIKEAMYVINVFQILGLGKIRVKVFNDNNGALSIANDEQCHQRTKHIRLKDLFMKEKVRDKFVILDRVNTNDLVADIMTKSLPILKHKKFTVELGVRRI